MFVREIILPGSGYSHPLKAEFCITQCGEFSWRLGSGWREEGASVQGGHWGACHEDSWGQRLLQAAQALPGLQFGESLKSPPKRPKHLYRDTWNWVPGVFRKCFWKSWNTSTHKIDTVPFTLCFPPNHSHDPPPVNLQRLCTHETSLAPSSEAGYLCCQLSSVDPVLNSVWKWKPPVCVTRSVSQKSGRTCLVGFNGTLNIPSDR